MCQYGIPATRQWFQTAMQVCFWVYFSLSVIASSGMYLIIWSTQSAHTRPTYASNFLILQQSSPYTHNDTNLDFSCLSTSPHGTNCCKPHRRPPRFPRSRKNQLHRNSPRSSLYSRNRIPCQLNDIQRVYLPTYDAKASSGDNPARNGTSLPHTAPLPSFDTLADYHSLSL